MSDLIERLRAAVARLKEYTDAPAEIYTVPGAIDRLAVKRDDVLMAQYRIAEAAAAVEDYNNALAEIERLRRFAWGSEVEIPGNLSPDERRAYVEGAAQKAHDFITELDRARTAIELSGNSGELPVPTITVGGEINDDPAAIFDETGLSILASYERTLRAWSVDDRAPEVLRDDLSRFLTWMKPIRAALRSSHA